MYTPWQQSYQMNQDMIRFFVDLLQKPEIKAEISKQVRVEVDTQRKKYSNSYRFDRVQSYESLTSGNVNMQARMAASGYDVYGRSLILANQPLKNDTAFKNMKNKLRYGKAPHKGYLNQGSSTIV